MPGNALDVTWPTTVFGVAPTACPTTDMLVTLCNRMEYLAEAAR